MNKASCLSLLYNAVLVWNTVPMSRIIRQLRATGVTITDEEVAFISPLAYAHIMPNGTYFFDRGGEEGEAPHKPKVLGQRLLATVSGPYGRFSYGCGR
jgi:hypothetical protein